MPKFLDDIEFPIEGGKGIHWNTIIDEPIIKADLNTENGVANTYYQHTGVTTNIYKNGLIYFCTGTEFKVIDGSGGSGGAVVELSGESGKLTDEQYEQCTLPNTTIKWLNGSGGNMIYEPWRFISPTYYFKSVYIDADECINNIIEIDQISHRWTRKSTAYSGGGGSVELTKETITDALGYTPSEPVSVIHKYTTGRNLADIKVGNLHYGIYSPYAECIEDVLELPTSFQQIDDSKIYRITKVQSLVGGVKNQMPNPITGLPDTLSGIPITIHHVETLPENPEYATDSYTAPTKMVFYYLVSGKPLFNLNDNRLYAYIPAGKFPMTNEDLSNTWQRVSTFLVGAFMMTDKGVITSEKEATSTGHWNMYFLADIELYHYRSGWQKVSKGVTEDKVSEMIEDTVEKVVEDIPIEAIIDVTSLPEEEYMYFYSQIEGSRIDYLTRIPEATTPDYFSGPYSIKVVDTLPEIGIPFYVGGKYTIYFQKSDGKMYGYSAPNASTTGWTEEILLVLFLGFAIMVGGVLTSEDQVPERTDNTQPTAWLIHVTDGINEKAIYRKGGKLYHYKDGWNEIGSGGGSGGGSKAVVSVSNAAAVFEENIYDDTVWTSYFEGNDVLYAEYKKVADAILANLENILSISLSLNVNMGMIVAMGAPLKFNALTDGRNFEIYLTGEILMSANDDGDRDYIGLTVAIGSGGYGHMTLTNMDADTVQMMSMLTTIFTINY